MDLFCSFSSFGLPFPLEGLEEIAVGIIKVDQPHMIAFGYPSANLHLSRLHMINELVKIWNFEGGHEPTALGHPCLHGIK